MSWNNTYWWMLINPRIQIMDISKLSFCWGFLWIYLDSIIWLHMIWYISEIIWDIGIHYLVIYFFVYLQYNIGSRTSISLQPGLSTRKWTTINLTTKFEVRFSPLHSVFFIILELIPAWLMFYSCGHPSLV